MAMDEQHVALPKLYGAPAYARPTIVVETARQMGAFLGRGSHPKDPDDE